MPRPGLNHGTLFTNRTSDNPKQPDWKGGITVEIREGVYQIDLLGWDRSSSQAGTYISLIAHITPLDTEDDDEDEE